MLHGVVGVLLGLALLALGGGPAAAHDRLVSSDPASGSVTEALPTQVVLTFSDHPLAVGTLVAVRGPDGTDVTAGPPTVAGTDVVVPLASSVPSGAYVVAWRVVSSDGHPIEGTFGFTVATSPAEPSSTDAPPRGDLATLAPAGTATLAPAQPGSTPTPPPESDAGPVLPPLARAAVAVAAVAALAAGAVATLRRRRRL